MDTYKGKTLFPLDENKPLQPGDVILIEFDWLINGDWFRAWQWSIIEKKIEGRKDWCIISTQFDADSLWVEIEIMPQTETELQTAGIPTVLIIGTIFTATVYALGRYNASYLIERKKLELVEKGLAPPSILESKQSALYQAGTGLKALGVASLICVAGWFLLSWRRH